MDCPGHASSPAAAAASISARVAGERERLAFAYTRAGLVGHDGEIDPVILDRGREDVRDRPGVLGEHRGHEIGVVRDGLRLQQRALLQLLNPALKRQRAAARLGDAVVRGVVLHGDDAGDQQHPDREET